MEMGQANARMQPILDFPFDLGTPTNLGERSNLSLLTFAHMNSGKYCAQPFPCEVDSIFDPIKRSVHAFEF